MALVSRLRLGERDEVGRVLAPYLEGAQDSFARPSQSALASHLLFVEYARRSGDDRAKAVVLRAAASGFTESGELREFMPMHGGWSDSLFMDVPILAMAGAHWRAALLRHGSPPRRLHAANRAQAGRSLSASGVLGRRMGARQCIPGAPPGADSVGVSKEHPDYPRLLTSHRTHMAALARFQDENGMWRNVIDRPGAYPEYSATAMIATAMLRGIRNGWIDRETYEPLIEKAWKGILARTGADGRLVDVCESTGTRGLTDDDYLAASPSSAATIAAAGWPCSSRRNSPAFKPVLSHARIGHLAALTALRCGARLRPPVREYDLSLKAVSRYQ